VLFFGGCGFLLTGISSKVQMNLLPFIHYEDVQFFPQGLVMSFYGIIALILSLYLGACIVWSVGGGFNEFNKKDGFVRIFRWGFPGKNRRIELVYSLKEIDCIKVDLQEGLNPRRSIYLRLKGKRDILLTRIGQPLTLEEIEKQAAELARFLQVGLEGIA
jgi:hypothetical protein